MIKTTLGSLATAMPALHRLADVVLPSRQAYHVAKLIKLTRDDVDIFQQQRNRLVVAYGQAPEPTADDLKRGITPSPRVDVQSVRWPEYEAKVNELAAQPVEVALDPFPREHLPDSIRASDLLALEPLLTVDA